MKFPNLFSCSHHRRVSSVAGTPTHTFSDRRELLKIQFNHSISKQTRVLLRVPLRHIHDVRFKNNGPDPSISLEPMNRRHRLVIPQPVLASGDAKPRHSPLVVEEIEPLPRRVRRKAADHVHVARAPCSHLEAFFDGASFDEVFVNLGTVEASHDGPDGLRRGLDALGEEGGAATGTELVGVELGD